MDKEFEYVVFKLTHEDPEKCITREGVMIKTPEGKYIMETSPRNKTFIDMKECKDIISQDKFPKDYTEIDEAEIGSKVFILLKVDGKTTYLEGVVTDIDDKEFMIRSNGHTYGINKKDILNLLIDHGNPFKSEKQRRYLWVHHPDIAERWSQEYGSKPRKSRSHKK